MTKLEARIDDERALLGDHAALLRALVRNGGVQTPDDPAEAVVLVRLPAPLWEAVRAAARASHA